MKRSAKNLNADDKNRLVCLKVHKAALEERYKKEYNYIERLNIENQIARVDEEINIDY